MLAPEDYFDLSATAHAALFDGAIYVWEALPRLGDYIKGLLAGDTPPNSHDWAVHPSVYIGENVYIGPDVQIAPGVCIEGPTWIGANAQIRHGAHVRANTLVAAGGVVGHATETKNALFLEGAAAPHFSYVGDSLLGHGVNLGAGTKLSNFPMNATPDPQTGARPTIAFEVDGVRVDTGIVKMGGILGDGAHLGCNVVANPGTLVGPRTMVYALTALRKGVYPADSIVKLRQTQEVVARRA